MQINNLRVYGSLSKLYIDSGSSGNLTSLVQELTLDNAQVTLTNIALRVNRTFYFANTTLSSTGTEGSIELEESCSGIINGTSLALAGVNLSNYGTILLNKATLLAYLSTIDTLVFLNYGNITFNGAACNCILEGYSITNYGTITNNCQNLSFSSKILQSFGQILGSYLYFAAGQLDFYGTIQTTGVQINTPSQTTIHSDATIVAPTQIIVTQGSMTVYGDISTNSLYVSGSAGN
jgi:hypothetical protein